MKISEEVGERALRVITVPIKAVILLAVHIREYNDEQSRPFFFGWFLLCGGMFLGVFVACKDSECADEQILTLFWLAMNNPFAAADFDRD